LPEFHHHSNLDLFFGSWPASQVTRLGMMGPLPYRQLMRSKKHSLQIFKSKFKVVTWCTPCLISFNYGYMVWVKFSNLNIHIAQCTPTSHLSEGGDDIEVSSVHRLINLTKARTLQTRSQCVCTVIFKLQCAQVVKCPTISWRQ